ncbi:MAG: 50S ribosomal protein L6 [Halobacteriota archaeon]|nr:50S ribosomal protein L6 [Halobacteriota archaeon]
MPKEIAKIIDIPDGVDVQIDGSLIKVSGPKGEVERELWHPYVAIGEVDSKVKVDTPSNRKKAKAMVGTYASHIQNMVIGVTEGFEYRLKIVFSHFPIQVKVAGSEVIIDNFLGGHESRRSKIIGDTKVEISSDEIIVSGNNKEDVGQTAANIEQSTKIKRFDPRVFQDGVYITSKGGRHGS